MNRTELIDRLLSLAAESEEDAALARSEGRVLAGEYSDGLSQGLSYAADQIKRLGCNDAPQEATDEA